MPAGRPLDIITGLTPAGGVMMGMRNGDLDPGVLPYLRRERDYDAERLERLRNEQAGLLGISGTTSDVETLLAPRDRDMRAVEAVAMFCYSARKQVGALATVRGGVDTLVFTGGFGERSGPVRWEICQRLEHMCIQPDPRENAANPDTVSARRSPCRVRVIPTNEDLMIARHTRAVVFPGPKR